MNASLSSSKYAENDFTFVKIYLPRRCDDVATIKEEEEEEEGGSKRTVSVTVLFLSSRES
tara:strand:- start:843 stop:1022 length:180 start_codon:yes stop_codon:yes gene_type:complete